jgi:hypothetical protein
MIDVQRHRRRMHANIRYRAAFPYQRLTHVEGCWGADGFHYDVETVDLGVEDLAGCFADFEDAFGRAGVNRMGTWAGEHLFRETEARVRKVEEGDAAGRVEGRCKACGETDEA